MIVISRTYTRTGDEGGTHLSDMSRTTKTDPRVGAYGDVDEANATLGLVLTTDGYPDDIADVLRIVQAELFDVGADLSNPVMADPENEPLRILDDSVIRLEQWCDQFSTDLPVLRTFVLPGGSRVAAALHLARTVTRRAERTAWLAAEKYGTEASADPEVPGGVNPVALRYLNRLSDLLFVLSRHANREVGEVLWEPGAQRRPSSPSRPG